MYIWYYFKYLGASMQHVTCETLLSDWFTNTLTDVDNQTVLLIASSPVFDTNKIRELLKGIEKSVSCHVEHLSKMLKDIDPFKMYRPNVKLRQNNVSEETNSIAKNLVFFVDHHSVAKIQSLIEICRENNKKILFAGAHETSQVLNNILKTFKDNNLQSKPLPIHSNCYLDEYSSDLIKLVTTDDLKQNLGEITQYRMKFMQVLFFDNIYLNELIQKKIMEDIVLLQRTNLLTSNLAMHLHHLTFFTSEINDIDAGRYIREELGIKSKTFTRNSKKLKKIQYVPFKPFKAYDLSTNMEKQIRLDIASKLILHIKSNPNQVLDSYSIAKITELSEEEVEEIYESYKRPKKQS